MPMGKRISVIAGMFVVLEMILLAGCSKPQKAAGDVTEPKSAVAVARTFPRWSHTSVLVPLVPISIPRKTPIVVQPHQREDQGEFNNRVKCNGVAAVTPPTGGLWSPCLRGCQVPARRDTGCTTGKALANRPGRVSQPASAPTPHRRAVESAGAQCPGGRGPGPGRVLAPVPQPQALPPAGQAGHLGGFVDQNNGGGQQDDAGPGFCPGSLRQYFHL